MTSRDYCFWLQGFFEIAEAKKNGGYEITDEQIDIIRRHLNLVFKHEIDPAMGGKEHQAELNKIHNNTFPNPNNEEEAIQFFGPKPSNKHKYNFHGWYDPAEGIPRC